MSSRSGAARGDNTGLRLVLALARPWRNDLRRGIASGIAQQVLFVAGAALAAYAAGRAVRGATYHQIDLYLLAVVLLVLPQVRTPWLESVALQSVANRVEVQLRERIFDAIDRLTPAGLWGRRSGDLGSVALADVTVVRRFFAETLSTLIVGATVPSLALVAVAALAWQLAIVAAPFVVLAAVAPVSVHRARHRRPASRAELGALSAEVVDTVQGLREIVAFNAQEAVLGRLAVGSRAARQAQVLHGRVPAAERVLAEVAATAGGLTVLAVGAALVAHHQVPVTYLLPAATLAVLAFGPVARLVEGIRSLGEVIAAGDRIFAILDAPVPIGDRTGEAADVPLGRHIRFREVGFRYRPDLPEALKDVSFTVGAGETVVLIGHSGAGKSTCVNLLLRFWDPQAGAITLGGVDLRDIPQKKLHRHVGFVAQETYLFNLTIADNIRLGRPSATDDEVEQACRAAAAWEFIQALPDRLQTSIGERGTQLSAGQRQRLAIARALQADPPVLILDEPASSLDADNERALSQAMNRLRAGRTTLLVGHRPSTIRTADRVVVLDHGRVIATGRPADLIDAEAT